MQYQIEFTGLAAKQFRKLDGLTASRVKSQIDELASNTHQTVGTKSLKGRLKGISRARVGDFRICIRCSKKRLLY